MESAYRPQFYEIWRLGEVPGVTTLFMVIDGLGGLCSALSLAFKESIDPLLAGLVQVLDALVILLKLILNPLAARRRAQAAAASSRNRGSTAVPIPEEPTETDQSVLRGPYSRPRSLVNPEVEHAIALAQVVTLPPLGRSTCRGRARPKPMAR